MTEQRPTFQGYVETPYDALLVLEATLLGILTPITKRLNSKERTMIKSGDVYVYEESKSGIKRWTEGRFWTPSRILGQFLIYRESEKDSKSVKQKGLLKKTISFQISECEHWHVVSYYSECDLEFGVLDTPSTVPELKSLKPRDSIGMFSLGRKKETESDIIYPLRQSTSINSNTTSTTTSVDLLSPWMPSNDFHMHSDTAYQFTSTPEIDAFFDQFALGQPFQDLNNSNVAYVSNSFADPTCISDPVLFPPDPLISDPVLFTTDLPEFNK